MLIALFFFLAIPTCRRLIPYRVLDEGWVLYAEKLTHKKGFDQDDPYGEHG